MKTTHQVHNLIILDESGSMHSIKETAIQGFNEIVQTIKGLAKEHPEQEHFIALITFNGIRQNLVQFIAPVSRLDQLDSSSYRPDVSTPLFDALGFGINKLKTVLERVNDYNVLVTILTDGEENSSREFSGLAIMHMIDELKHQRWTFTYIGTDHDVEKMAASISVNNTMHFGKNETDMKRMFAREMDARSIYFQKISRNEDTESDYYGKEQPENNADNDNTRPRSAWGKLFGKN